LRVDQQRPSFFYEDEQYPVPNNVWTFFRDVRRIETLETKGFAVKIVLKEFDHKNRSAYSSQLQQYLDASLRPLLLFLDPDTGLAPKTAKKEHVTDKDLEQSWSELCHGDWLVLYQHRWRNRNWIDAASNRLSGICGGTKIEVARSEEIANDVAFLCVPKRL
jgi:hypothetical protein